jgi:hypothetical protein
VYRRKCGCMEHLLSRRPFLYRLQSGYYMMGSSKFQKSSNGYDQITAIKFWDEVAKIGETKMVPQWSVSGADKNRLSTFFAIALKHAQGMWSEAGGTYAQSVTLLNGLSDADKELLKKEVDIFVACMQNLN